MHSGRISYKWKGNELEKLFFKGVDGILKKKKTSLTQVLYKPAEPWSILMQIYNKHFATIN